MAGGVGQFHALVREQTWQEVLEEAGLPTGPRIQGDWSAGSGYAAAHDLLNSAELPTAVLAANDMVALGLLRGFAEAGVRVPQDVSVIGFDDVEGTDQAIPPLTTVRQDFTKLGVRCFNLLMKVIHSEPVSSELIPTRLVVRGSTGPCRPLVPSAQLASW